MKDQQEFETWATAMKRRRRVAWLLILIADAGLLMWGAMAALAPSLLPGPRSAPILAAGYESFTRGSWQELVDTSPMTAAYIMLLFRLYGAYIVAFGVLAIAITVGGFRRGDGWAWWALLVGNTIAFGAAMTYDWTVSAIGPFEMSEYVGIAAIYVALAITAPLFGRTACSIDGLTRPADPERSPPPHRVRPSHCSDARDGVGIRDARTYAGTTA